MYWVARVVSQIRNCQSLRRWCGPRPIRTSPVLTIRWWLKMVVVTRVPITHDRATSANLTLFWKATDFNTISLSRHKISARWLSSTRRMLNKRPTFCRAWGRYHYSWVSKLQTWSTSHLKRESTLEVRSGMQNTTTSSLQVKTQKSGSESSTKLWRNWKVKRHLTSSNFRRRRSMQINSSHLLNSSRHWRLRK